MAVYVQCWVLAQKPLESPSAMCLARSVCSLLLISLRQICPYHFALSTRRSLPPWSCAHLPPDLFPLSASRPSRASPSPRPLLGSAAAAKTRRCAAITLIDCDFFIYMTSARRSWEPTACSPLPAPRLWSARDSAPVSFWGGEGRSGGWGGGRQKGSGTGCFFVGVVGGWRWVSRMWGSGGPGRLGVGGI